MAFFISLLPILILFLLMLVFKLNGWKSAAITLIATFCLMVIVAPKLGIVSTAYKSQSIYSLALFSVAEGVLKAMFPILLIIFAAIFSYNLLVESNQIENLKKQITSLTEDRGILVLIITWGFGGLLEGMAGFGTAVAIPAAILIGLGFKPFFSALVSLLANTVATGFAAVGVPIITLCNEATKGGIASIETIQEVSAMSICQLGPLFFLVPFAILELTQPKDCLKNILLAFWVGGISLTTQLVCALKIGAETPAIIGSIAAILALILASFILKKGNRKNSAFSIAGFFKAWSIYLLILFLVLLSGPLCKPVNYFLNHHLVMDLFLPAVSTHFHFGWLSNTALMILVGSIIGGLIQGVNLKKQGLVMAKTILALRFTSITIICLISMASIMNYSGMINTIALGMVAITGDWYPLFAPVIGAVGTFVTGSDTSSNILFAKLQVSAAQHLGLTDTKVFMGITGSESNWLLAANTTGATGGKMISPQSIAIATAACDMKDSDDAILKSAIPYALAYVLIAGLMVFLFI